MTPSNHEQENRLPIDALEAGIDFLTSQPATVETDPAVIESLRELGLYEEPASPEELTYVKDVMAGLLPKVETINGYIEGQENPSPELQDQSARYTRAIDATKAIFTVTDEVKVEKVTEPVPVAKKAPAVKKAAPKATPTPEVKASTEKPLIAKSVQLKIAKFVMEKTDKQTRSEFLQIIKQGFDIAIAKRERKEELTANETKALLVRENVDKAFKHLLEKSEDGVIKISQLIDTIFSKEYRKEIKNLRRVHEFIAIHIFDRSDVNPTKAGIAVKVGESLTVHSPGLKPRPTYHYRVTDEYAEYLGVEQKYTGETAIEPATDEDSKKKVAEQDTTTPADETPEVNNNTDADETPEDVSDIDTEEAQGS